MRLKTITEIPKIMVKVLVQSIRPPWTTIHPRQKRVLPITARGRHVHFGGPAGTCIGCGRCSRVCPNVAITVHRKRLLHSNRLFKMHLLRLLCHSVSELIFVSST